jgi:outer membrane protein OmpA-like peptidoglycan-associated protein
VDYTELRVAGDSVAQVFYQYTKSGKSLEDIYRMDSVRMAQPTAIPTRFAAGSSRLTPAITKLIAPLVAEMKIDPTVRLALTPHPDTSARKAQNMKLADQRVAALKAHFKRNGIAEDRVSASARPFNRKAMPDSLKERNVLNQQVNVDVLGRRQHVLGPPQTQLVAITADERSMKADSLQLQQISEPFRSKFGMSLIRLNARDPLRHKTLEEAGTEVSSSFQEFESKRLETEWVDRLKKQHPVVEYREVLKSAFAPRP